MQRFKDKLKEIEKQEELIQKKKTMLDQKLLGQKLLEQQKAMTSSLPTETPSSKSPANQNHSLSGQQQAAARLNAFSNDGSFLKAFQLIQKQGGSSGTNETSKEKSADHRSSSSGNSSPILQDNDTSVSPLPPDQFGQQHQMDPYYYQHQRLPGPPVHFQQQPPPQQQYAMPSGPPPPPPPQFHPGMPPPNQFAPFPNAGPHGPPNSWQQMPPFIPPFNNNNGNNVNFSPGLPPSMPVPFQQMGRYPTPYGNIPGLPLPPPPPPPPPPLPIETSQLKEGNAEPYDPLRPTEDSDNEEPEISQPTSKSPVTLSPADMPSLPDKPLQKRAHRSRWAEREEADKSRSRSRSRSSSGSPSPLPKVSSAPSPRRVAEMIAKQLSANMPPSIPTAQKVTGGEMNVDQLKQFKEQQQLKAMEEYIRARQNAQRAALAIKSGQMSAQALAKKRGPKYEYDSDEEIDEEGTWEHKARRTEMDATRDWAQSLDEMSHGKHHIGDFLPPDELKKFVETFEALKEGRTPQISDYEKFKLTCENVGFQMLKKLGWKEGEGLGSSGQGIVEPVGRGAGFLGDGSSGVASSSSAAVAPLPAVVAVQNFGAIGATAPVPNNYQLSSEDDEFDAYRKRMMLAYRFRPNPLNNPRRPYY